MTYVHYRRQSTRESLRAGESAADLECDAANKESPDLVDRSTSASSAAVCRNGKYGLEFGEIYSLFPATCGDTFGSKYATTNAGMLYTAKGTAAALVPLASLAAAAYGWSAVFAIAVAFNFGAALLALFVLKPLRARFLFRSPSAGADPVPLAVHSSSATASGWGRFRSRTQVQAGSSLLEATGWLRSGAAASAISTASSLMASEPSRSTPPAAGNSP